MVTKIKKEKSCPHKILKLIYVNMNVNGRERESFMNFNIDK